MSNDKPLPPCLSPSELEGYRQWEAHRRRCTGKQAKQSFCADCCIGHAIKKAVQGCCYYTIEHNMDVKQNVSMKRRGPK